jgi:hypothetical protein
MKKLIKITFILVAISCEFLGASLYAQSSVDELDKLSLAALLIKNKNYSRASSVLSEIKDPHEVIPEKYWGLKGLVELKQKRFQEALNAFDMAEKEGLKSTDLYLGQAQAYLGLKNYTNGLKVLEKNKLILEKEMLYYQLRASLGFEADLGEMAWKSLHLGMSKFPKALPLIKQKWFYLVQNNLLEVSFQAAKDLVDNYEVSALDVARMGQLYRQKGDSQKAIFFGEIARLKDQTDEEIIKDLARSYLKKENFTAAAQLFTNLSQHNPKFLTEASELWRKAGFTMYAENLALEIRDPVKKIKQNLTLALLNEDFNRMAGLGIEANRTTLKSDQDIQYALAYANFMIGAYEEASANLKIIQRPDLFKKAVALKEVMEACEKGENLCF